MNATMEALRQRGLARLPKLGIVLGSGLGLFTDEVHNAIAVPYDEIPDFPEVSVAGHAGRLVVGEIAGCAVALFQGRSHYYERGDVNAMRSAIETFQALGGERLLLTNAAGGLHQDWRPPTLVNIVDHINFAGVNPLIGERTDRRFVPLVDAYDPQMRRSLQEAAERARVVLRQGVYMWFSGPSFETPAEIRAARALGADVVGMSTVPEVLIGRFLGLRCAAVSLVTNYAAGLFGGDPSHKETQEVARLGSESFKNMLRAFISVDAGA